MKVLTLTPRKPIIYPPGIISLVLLPVFCLVFLNKHKAFEHQGIIDVAVWDPAFAVKENKYRPKVDQIKFPPDRKYLNIKLSGNNADDKIRLDFARLEIKRILQSKDIVNGVDFHFENKAQYWTFVSAIGICQIADITYYAPYKNDVYVGYLKPRVINDKARHMFFCGTQQAMQEDMNRQLRNERLKKVDKIARGFWPLGIAFFIMSFFAIRKAILKS